MAFDFTFIGYSLLAGHLLVGAVLATGGYLLIKKVFSRSKNGTQIPDKTIRIDVGQEKDKPTISQAA